MIWGLFEIISTFDHMQNTLLWPLINVLLLLPTFLYCIKIKIHISILSMLKLFNNIKYFLFAPDLPTGFLV